MRYILSPNPEPPHNLRRTFPNLRDRSLEHLTEEQAMSFIIEKLRSSGVIAGEYWIVDEKDLPGGEVSETNDLTFDAWEMKEGKVTVNQAKVKQLGLG